MEQSGDNFFFIQPTEMRAGITPNHLVSLSLGKPPASLGFDPSIVFATELTPTEARALADLLVRKAREAEGGSSQH